MTRRWYLVAGAVAGLVSTYSLGCDRGEPFVAEPAVPSVSLTANPPAGTAPLTVGLTAVVTDPPTGPLAYAFDCTDDGSADLLVSTVENPYTAPDLCTYPDTGGYTAKVVLTLPGDTLEATTSVSVTAAPPAGADSVVVIMQDNVFVTADLTVEPGTVIIWQNAGARPHTATADDGSWDSGTLNSGESWSWTVPSAAPAGSSFPYYCIFHGTAGGIGMAGTIRVATGGTAPDSLVVRMKDNFFSAADVTVAPGIRVVWQNTGLLAHTATSDAGLFDSGALDNGQSWSWTVPAGALDGTTYPYYCVFHGDVGGVAMAGVIRVAVPLPPPAPPPHGTGRSAHR